MNTTNNVQHQQIQHQDTQQERQQSCFSSLFCCCKRRDLQPVNTINTMLQEDIFGVLPEKTNNFQLFIERIRNKLGIIFIYQEEDMRTLQEFVQLVSTDQTINDLIKQNCVTYSTKNTSIEGILIASSIRENLLFPSIIFCYNSNQRTIFNKESVIERLEEPTTLEMFNNILLNTLEKKTFEENKQHNNPYDKKDIDNISNAEIIEQQKRDLLELEREERKKNEEAKKRIEEERKKKEEENQKIKFKEERRLSLINKIPPEPKEHNDLTTAIVFRYPDGEKRKERLFYKTDTVQLLYDYIESLGSEIYTEPDFENFELIQSFPFKSYKNKTKTLEEEKLYPNAVIQIKELL